MDGVIDIRLLITLGGILAAMSSPENMRRDHMQIADVLANVTFLREEVERLRKLHNGAHPPVASERHGV
jgi:hypothetical protein